MTEIGSSIDALAITVWEAGLQPALSRLAEEGTQMAARQAVQRLNSTTTPPSGNLKKHNWTFLFKKLPKPKIRFEKSRKDDFGEKEIIKFVVTILNRSQIWQKSQIIFLFEFPANFFIRISRQNCFNPGRLFFIQNYFRLSVSIPAKFKSPSLVLTTGIRCLAYVKIYLHVRVWRLPRFLKVLLIA